MKYNLEAKLILDSSVDLVWSHEWEALTKNVHADKIVTVYFVNEYDAGTFGLFRSFVFLFVRSFVCWFVRSIVCLLVYSLVRCLLFHSFISSLRKCAYLLVCSFIRLFVVTFVGSLGSFKWLMVSLVNG